MARLYWYVFLIGTQLAVFAGLVPLATGQDIPARSWRIGLSPGILIDGHKDRQVSPLRYNGIQVPVRFELQYAGSSVRNGLVLTAAFSGYSSGITDGTIHAEKGFSGVLEGYYTSKIRSIAPLRAGLFGGVAIRGTYQYTYHRYTSSIREFVGMAAVSIGPSLVVPVAPVRRSLVTLRMSAPLLALVVRPPYSIKGRIDERLVTVDQFAGMDFDVVHDLALSHRIILHTGYTFQYNYTGFPETYRSIGHSVFTGLSVWL